MLGVRRGVVLSILAIIVMLSGTMLPLVNAAFADRIMLTYSQSLQADDNGHTYLFVDETPGWAFNYQKLNHDTDLDYSYYSYMPTSWIFDSGSWAGPGNRSTILLPGVSYHAGWLHDYSGLPIFWDIENTTNEYNIEVEENRFIFSLPIGTETTVALEPGVPHYGVFNVTEEEYFHLTIGSRQDSTEVGFTVLDSSGVSYIEGGLWGGDIGIWPFAPGGEGTYNVLLECSSTYSGLAIVDLLLESVVPDELNDGEILEGVLPGSEFVVKNNPGDIVHQEKAPSAHSFKFSSNFTHPGRFRYLVNHPELDDDIYDPFETMIFLSSDAYTAWWGGLERYYAPISSDGDAYYYQSFQNETYYFTIIGMEETVYYLLNEIPNVNSLPLNHEFYLEAPMGTMADHAFTLQLGADSVLKLNSTESADGFGWTIWRTFDDGIHRSLDVFDASTFHAATPVYLPAGNYIVIATPDNFGASGIYEFTVGPILEGAGGVAVDNYDLVGVRVPTEVAAFYRVNITLETKDNVSVYADYDILNTYGANIYNWEGDLGNIQSGTGWVDFGGNWTARELGLSPFYTMFCDGFGLLVISPYQVYNNTGGSESNKYHKYTADYNVHFEEYSADLFNGTGTLSVTDSPAIYNFTLGDPGDSVEIYRLGVTCPRGTWMNVSFYTEDVSNIIDVIIYQEDDGYTTRLDLTGALSLTAYGTVDAGGFLLGSISDEMVIVFRITRTLSEEGSLDILLSPFLTNSYQYPPPIPYVGPSTTVPAGDWLAQNALLLVGGAGAAVAVVIVAYVLVKRRRGEFSP